MLKKVACFVMLSFVVLSLGEASAKNVTRECNYQLFYDGRNPDFSPQLLEGSALQVVVSLESYRNNASPAAARKLARDVAKKCLSAAVDARVRPMDCNPNGRITDERTNKIIGTVETRFPVDNLKAETQRQICQFLNLNQLGQALRSYRLSVKTLGSSDVRRECNNDQVLFEMTNLNCSGSVSMPRPEQRWSKWYNDLSPMQMHNWIADYCKNDRNSYDSSIERWQQNPANGSFRVFFNCK